jgi:hypothetical protein
MPRSKKPPSDQLVLFVPERPLGPDRKPVLEEWRRLEALWWSQHGQPGTKGEQDPLPET